MGKPGKVAFGTWRSGTRVLDGVLQRLHIRAEIEVIDKAARVLMPNGGRGAFDFNDRVWRWCCRNAAVNLAEECSSGKK